MTEKILTNRKNGMGMLFLLILLYLMRWRWSSLCSWLGGWLYPLDGAGHRVSLRRLDPLPRP